MQVSVEKTSELGRRLTIEIPAEAVTQAVQERMESFSPRAKLDGFRQGKIPKQVLEKQFGAKIREEAVGKLIETSLPAAFSEKALKPAGRPVVENIQNDVNKPLIYVVNFEVFPEFKIAEYNNLKLEKFVVVISEKDLDQTLEKVKEQTADWIESDKPARIGDRVIVDYTSTMNGKPYEQGAGKDVAILLGSKLFLEGFEQGLVGANKDETKILDLKFPNDWRIEKLAGKPVQFTVKVKGIQIKQLPELNEAFAKKIGAASADIKDIREKIKESLTKQTNEWVEAKVREKLTEALLDANKIPVPKALIEREADVLHEEYHRKMGDKPVTACHHQGLMEQAELRVKLGLILNEVIKLEDIKPDEALVRARIASMAKMFGNAEFLESMYYESEELLSGVRHTVLLDQALELILEKATIIEKKTTMDALLKAQNEETKDSH